MAKVPQVFGPLSKLSVVEARIAQELQFSHHALWPSVVPSKEPIQEDEENNNPSKMRLDVDFEIKNGNGSYRTYGKPDIMLPYDVSSVPKTLLLSKNGSSVDVCKPDIITITRFGNENIVRPVDFKHSSSDYRPSQVSSSNLADLINRSPYLQKALEFVKEEFGIASEELTIDNGKTIYLEYKKPPHNDYVNELLQRPIFKQMFGLEYLKDNEVLKLVSSVQRMKESDIKDKIRNVGKKVLKRGYSAYTTIYIDKIGKNDLNVLFQYQHASHVVDNGHLVNGSAVKMNDEIQKFNEKCLYKPQPLDSVPMRLFITTGKDRLYQVLLRREELIQSKQEYAEKE